ncbi:hypothetical protein D1872_286420 [compost metagenome]
MWTIAQINNHLGKRLIHGNKYTRIPLDALLVSQRLLQRLSQANTDILHRMMVVDLNISSCLHLQIELSVLRE